MINTNEHLLPTSIQVDIASERLRQKMKWGTQHHPWATWISILAEEFGEAAKEANDLLNNDNAGGLERLRTELVQVAAVSVQILQAINQHIHDHSDIITEES